MKSPTALKHNTGLAPSPTKSFWRGISKRDGFTLVEILVVMGMLAMIFVIGSLVNINFYTRELTSSEETTLIGILQKARSRSMNNLHQSSHGIHFDESEENYVLFRGTEYIPDADTNETVPRNPNIDIDPSSGDVVFEQLSGNLVSTSSEEITLTLSDNSGRTKEINIKANGLIDW